MNSRQIDERGNASTSAGDALAAANGTLALTSKFLKVTGALLALGAFPGVMLVAYWAPGALGFSVYAGLGTFCVGLVAFVIGRILA